MQSDRRQSSSVPVCANQLAMTSTGHFAQPGKTISRCQPSVQLPIELEVFERLRPLIAGLERDGKLLTTQRRLGEDDVVANRLGSLEFLVAELASIRRCRHLLKHTLKDPKG
jgi:hypothetical protein